MKTMKAALLISALAAQLSLMGAISVSAMPIGQSAGLSRQIDAARPVIEVRDRGAGVAAGFIGGMIIGGIIASQAPRYYYEPYPIYRSYPMVDGAIAYCMRRFRSYDPYSMTYLGYDGYRRPCP
jgi:hypothetical protein